MTIQDVLNLHVNQPDIAAASLSRVAMDGSVTFDNTTDMNVFDVARAYAYKTLAAQPDWSEDGLSAKYNRAYLISEANRIFSAQGMADEVIGAPTIISKTNQW